MKRATPALVLLLCATACSTSPPKQQVTIPTSTPPTATPQSTDQGPPTTPEPVADGPCPYLDSTFVADANGQHVTKVRISADKPHPACFFYRPDGTVQLTVRVYVGDAKNAKALVDQAAPIATSNPASSPPGWKGGSLGQDKSSVYAVAKDVTAVIVTSNQAQSTKPRRVAEKAITALGL
ncbi:DUF2020 domain-containing protein [Actinocrispum wychmicini]|uniref:Uncharacterized protein DUF2020 n=1 Tax=Actinocrispum wychmicini TaxID=1213861 RepID=A0A4R2JZ67_9PSEU|nr:DUF2020 domain-containing protein [Actinocrispum wychmicini]TCO64647.1 uncharacterized protein DUF2020 [Actinocrispum wychmicini]